MEHTKELIEKSHAGDNSARDELVLENTGLVYSVARRFMGRGYELEDLFQLGTIGLIKAIDKFDCSYDVKLSTYAVPMISGEIKRFLRDDGIVKVSRSLKENGWKIRRATEKLVHELGREVTIEELVAETNLEKEEIVMALEANMEVESIHKSVYQSDGSEIYLVDQLASNENEKEKILDDILIKKLMNELEDKEEELIRLRYFKNLTQTQVAKTLGISQVQVSRLEKKILTKMRKYVEI